MGIRKLNKFLISLGIMKTYQDLNEYIGTFYKDCPNTKNNSRCGKIVIAIDFWLYVHKYLHSIRSNNIVIGFFNQILKFLSNGILPIYVMDGSVPIEKRIKVEERTRKKEKLLQRENSIKSFVNLEGTLEGTNENIFQKQTRRIKKSELRSIYHLFDVIGIPYIKAEFEADALCAKLYKEKIITGCLSDDMDILALGCGSTIKFSEGKLIVFNLEQIKSSLGFTQEQFIDMCLLFGCDYLQHSFRFKCCEVYEMIKKHGSLLEALRSDEYDTFNIRNNNIKVIGEHYYHVKDIYLNSPDREIIPKSFYNLKLNKISFDNVLSFIRTLQNFDTSFRNIKSIKNKIKFINKMIGNNIL